MVVDGSINLLFVGVFLCEFAPHIHNNKTAKKLSSNNVTDTDCGRQGVNRRQTHQNTDTERAEFETLAAQLQNRYNAQSARAGE